MTTLNHTSRTFSLAAGAEAKLEVKAVLVGVAGDKDGLFKLGLSRHLLIQVGMNQAFTIDPDVSSFKVANVAIGRHVVV